MEKEPMVEIGIGWEKYENGSQYYAGYFLGKEFVLYKNNRKENEKHPDWKGYFKDKEGHFFEVIGLYNKQSKTGRPFMSGSFSKTISSIAFIQTNKKSEKAPDIKIYVQQKKTAPKAEGAHNNIGNWVPPMKDQDDFPSF